jgi:2-polyprenyl-3-methyl-5-hydroxy-6-metoxy-1,4-benzoquinol methylase
MDLNQISQSTIDRYSRRYNQFGLDIKTLGWGSTEQQHYRFLNTLSASDFTNKTILDIGCGFGDYANFLDQEKLKIKSYDGWDLNSDLIDESNKNKSSNSTFNVFNLSTDNLDDHKDKYDIAVMLGLLNFNLKSQQTNLEYSKLMIKKAFDVVKEVLIVDFLSENLFPGYPKEDFVFYHNPAQILDFALTLSEKVLLKHDYKPIPQKEFMLYIYK